MLGIIFMFAGEMVMVKVDGNHVLFNSGISQQWSTIDGLQLSYEGVCKEFPDLKDQVNWKLQAIERFKDKLANYDNDEDRVDYIIQDLKKYGYVPKYIQKGGHRVKRIKNDKWRDSI